MEIELFKTLGKLFGIGGLTIGFLLIVIYKIFEKNIFSKLDKNQSFKIIRLLIILSFLIGIIGLCSLLITNQNTFDFTVFIESDDNSFKPNNSTKLILKIDNDKRTETIDNKGSATFKQIPSNLKGDSLTIELIAPLWQFTNCSNKSIVIFKGKSATLKIQRDNSLCCVVGSVRNEENEFLSGVIVNIGKINDTTDNMGRFNIEIPKNQQKEEQVLTAFHKGYKIWEKLVYPATKSEVPIVLKKK